MHLSAEEIAHIIEQTKRWVIEVVIGCNFCPFASREVKRGTVHYQVATATDTGSVLKAFLAECKRLDQDLAVETVLLIIPKGLSQFPLYLQLVERAEKLLHKNGYEGIYQVATFHPDYRFANAPADDAANFTNRSPYPVLHLLREASIEKALRHYEDPESIPQRNIHFARNKGFTYMKLLRDSCL